MRYILIMLWLLLGLGYFLIAKNVCGTDQLDNENSSLATTETKEPCIPIDPFYFNWSSDVVVPTKKWDLYLEDMLSDMTETSKIRITGLYVNKEKNTSSFDNLGLARADAMAQLIGLAADKYQIVNDSIRNFKLSTDCPITGAQLRMVTVSKKIKEIAANVSADDNTASAYDRTLIYFPVNSVNKLADAEVENYLDELAEKVVKMGSRIELDGHTDNSGDTEYNLELGERRANIIKQYLLSQHVNTDMIFTKSFGDSKPIATNDTEEGRAENRRTELRIIND